VTKVIITGGAGFIGTNLALSAIDRGFSVVIFDNLSRKGSDLNLQVTQKRGPGLVTMRRGDLRSQDDVNQLLAAHADATAIFHLGGQPAVTTSVADPRADFDSNVVGTLHLLEAARAAHFAGTIVYASTNKVYGDLESVAVVESSTRYAYRDYPHGIPESFPLNFVSPYGCSKGAADQYVLDYCATYNLNTVVFRQSCIYGPNQFGVEDQGWVAWFTIASLFGLPINICGTGKQVRDVLFVTDLLDAYWRAVAHIDRVRGKAFNIGGGSIQMSLLELLRHLEKEFDTTLHYSSSPARRGDQRVYVSDTRLAERELGWKPRVSVEEGVRQLAEWTLRNRSLFQEAGLIK
jgi:CDP-paratose 2-epimerase